jgi:hypothetical protein
MIRKVSYLIDFVLELIFHPYQCWSEMRKLIFKLLVVNASLIEFFDV